MIYFLLLIIIFLQLYLLGPERIRTIFVRFGRPFVVLVIAVLMLHVFVIGGFVVYHLLHS